MESNKETNYFLTTLLLLFVVFLIVYITKETGIYEYKAHTKATLTAESIKQFEKDLSEGKDVTLNDYVVDDYVDYSNKVTNLGYKTTVVLEDIMNNGIKKTLKIISALFFN